MGSKAGTVALPTSDGLVTLRRFVTDDRRLILEGRDGEWARWLGPGSPDPSPTASIEVSGNVVGWIDADVTAPWLRSGEANVGYSIFPSHRGNGYAARALRLLATELADEGVRRVLLVIDVRNDASLAVARAAGAQVLDNRFLPELPSSAVYAVELGDHADRWCRVRDDGGRSGRT